LGLVIDKALELVKRPAMQGSSLRLPIGIEINPVYFHNAQKAINAAAQPNKALHGNTNLGLNAIAASQQTLF